MNRAIDDLMHEHEAILEALEILKSIAGRLETGKTVEEGDISDLLGFLKLFADSCHHGKEEGFLFPLLANAGLSEDEGPVRVMLLEHERGRELIRAMESASFPKLEPARFAAAARGYIDLLHNHIRKENTILFPLASRLLTEHLLDGLGVAFEEHEASVVGEGRHEELHELLKVMRARYAAG